MSPETQPINLDDLTPKGPNMDVTDLITEGTNRAGNADLLVDAIDTLNGEYGQDAQVALTKALARADGFDETHFDSPDSLDQLAISLERERLVELLEETLSIMPETPSRQPREKKEATPE